MKKIISIILVILWMSFIFIMSNFPSVTSDAQSGFFVTLLSNLFNIDNINILTLIIRKTAHLFEYFVLGILVFCMLKSFNIKKLILFSGLTCILYSVSDEIHQMFVVGRSCELRDMLIDSLGSILGIIIIYYIIKLINIKKQGSDINEK